MFWGWIQYPRLMQCSATADLSVCSRGMSLVQLDPGLNSFTHCRPYHIYRVCCIFLESLSPKSYFTGQLKLGLFFGRRSTDLVSYLDNSLLLDMKVVLTNGRNVIETGFSRCGVTLNDELRACLICRLL